MSSSLKLLTKLLFHAVFFVCLFVMINLFSPHLQTYNAELAGVAQAYSLMCQFEHSNNDRSPSFSTIGENIYLGQGVAVNYTNFIVDSWSNSESVNYDFDSNTCRVPPCGHYTQVSSYFLEHFDSTSNNTYCIFFHSIECLGQFCQCWLWCHQMPKCQC